MSRCISSIGSALNKYIGNYFYKTNQQNDIFPSDLPCVAQSVKTEDYLSKYTNFCRLSLFCAIFKLLCLLFGLELQFWSFELRRRNKMNSNIKNIFLDQEFLFLLIIVKSDVGSWACYSVILTFICFQCSIQDKQGTSIAKIKKNMKINIIICSML